MSAARAAPRSASAASTAAASSAACGPAPSARLLLLLLLVVMVVLVVVVVAGCRSQYVSLSIYRALYFSGREIPFLSTRRIENRIECEGGRVDGRAAWCRERERECMEWRKRKGGCG